MNRTVFRAMGTEVVAFGADISRVAAFFAEAEAVFSRFDDSSELSSLNGDREAVVAISSELAACLGKAAEMNRLTGGLFDPAVGNAVEAWGYDRSFEKVTDLSQPRPIENIGRWAMAGTSVHRRPGVKLDLGGIAKGFAADRAVERGLARVVSAGGDVRSDDPDATVSIEDPWGEIAATIRLGVGGLATSSSTRRRWKVGGSDAHHIIDPRRIRPAVSPVFSATVTAATATEAEAGAKAVLLHGEHGLAWAQQQDWIAAALVVWHDGNVYATSGWEMAA